jgi:hypothetical protein
VEVRKVEKKRRNKEMEWQFVVALAIAIPVILFPAAFVWYLNIGGLYTAAKEARQARAARKQTVTGKVKA